MTTIITYVVNSNFGFHRSATKVLFNSLDTTGEDWKHHFVVIVGESPVNETKTIDGVRHVFVTYGAIDFVAANYITDHVDEFNEYVFYMHDTCYVGPTFFSNVDKFQGIYYKRLRFRYSMNIGLFKTELFQEFQPTIKQLRFDTMRYDIIQGYKEIGIQYEDILSRLVEEHPTMQHKQVLGDAYHFNNDEEICYNDVDLYGTGNLRQVIYIPELDFYKAKANIGMKPKNNWIIQL